MTLRQTIDSFLDEKIVAVVGVSRSGKRFGNVIFNELRGRGLTVYPVNPNVDSIGQDRCYPDVKSLPDGVGGVITVVKPDQTMEVVKQAHDAGIKKIWMQQGSESQEALDYCAAQQMEAIGKKCILMFAEPVTSYHGIHRFFARLFGTFPKK
jgi:predicted CoA-binding protein